MQHRKILNLMLIESKTFASETRRSDPKGLIFPETLRAAALTSQQEEKGAEEAAGSTFLRAECCVKYFQGMKADCISTSQRHQGMGCMS